MTEQNTALAQRGPGALVRQAEADALEALKAAGIDIGDQTGKDQIDSNNLILPFLAVAQKTNPQIEEGTPEYCADLKFLDLFESLDGNVTEIHGRGPVRFIPLILREHAMEFKPWTEGGGIVDRNVPLDDERCKFHGDEKPKATTFRDWVVLLLPKMELAILSFKGTSLKAGGVLKTFTKNPRVPLFAQVYTVRVEKGTDGNNSWGVLIVKPAGVADAATAVFAKKTLESASKKNIEINHEAEREVVAGEVVPPTTSRGPDDIPF